MSREYADESFPAAARAQMVACDLTFRMLSSRTGLSPGYLCHIVNGDRPVPLRLLGRVAEGFGLPADYWLETRVQAIARLAAEDPALCERLYRHVTGAGVVGRPEAGKAGEGQPGGVACP